MAKKKNEPRFNVEHTIEIKFTSKGEPRMSLYCYGTPMLPIDSDMEEISKVLSELKESIDNRPCKGLSM